MEAEVDLEGNLVLKVTMPKKEFKTGKKGWFKQGNIEVDMGERRKVKLNLQAYLCQEG